MKTVIIDMADEASTLRERLQEAQAKVAEQALQLEQARQALEHERRLKTPDVDHALVDLLGIALLMGNHGAECGERVGRACNCWMARAARALEPFRGDRS